MKIKVCGMRDPENIGQVCEAGPDFLGFIVHRASPRDVGENPDPAIFDRIPAHIRKTGVFVDKECASLIRFCKKYGFFAAQLHGNESPRDCGAVRKSGLTVIKAFSLHEAFDFRVLERYAETADFFLFDTKGGLRGGTGLKFNWQILGRYRLAVPFFLSGGIRPDDAGALRKLSHPKLYAIDINSGFETAPALKDAGKVSRFIEEIKTMI
ncbi:MAG: phosphoribosylanthranilate isomerase [Mangrovibacterium sp.]|nr:phosphoribosylanthranilate isomerase [Mangrovibacterium sp.]